MLTLRSSTPINSALQQLSANQRTQATWMERLASGARINSAKDDAAGLAISEVLETRLSSQDVLKRNVLSGLDVTSIADAGLGEVSSIIHRMRELALASLNDTVSDDQRAMLQLEFAELNAGLTEAAEATEYDGMKLLSAPHVDVAFLIDTSGSMNPHIAALKASVGAFRQQMVDAGFDVSFALVDVNHTRDPGDGTWSRVDLTDNDFDTELNNLTTQAGSMDPYSALLNASGVGDLPGTQEPDTLSWRTGTKKHLIYISDTGRQLDLIPGNETEAGIGASLAAEGFVVDVITPPSKHNEFDEITGPTGGGAHAIGANGSGIAAALQQISDDVALGADENGAAEIQVGLDGGADDRITIELPVDATAAGLGINEQTIATKPDALAALDALDAALEKLGSIRAGVGAAQNRLEVAQRNLQTSITSDAQTNSRIRDLDIAEGVANLTNSRIRSDLAVSVLTQAKNLQRQVVLGLLNRE